MMKSYQIGLIVVVNLIAISFAGEVCRDYSEWCHYMSKYGSCTWNNETRKTCPRTCGICTVPCPNTEPLQRRDCGYAGIQYLECFQKGCCYAPLEAGSKHPWCFHPNVKCPNMEPSLRRDCGYVGITKTGCIDKGCCWSPLEADSKYPWCFHPVDKEMQDFM